MKKSSRQPAYPAWSPSCFRCSSVGLAMSQGWKTYACQKQSSSASSRKESMIVVLQESVTKTSWTDSLHRQESTISHGSERRQAETVCAHQWGKPVTSSRQRHEAGKERWRRQKKPTASQLSSAQTFTCPKCSRVCTSRIRLQSHQHACKNWPSTFPKILVYKESTITICCPNLCCALTLLTCHLCSFTNHCSLPKLTAPLYQLAVHYCDTSVLVVCP